MTEVIKSIGVKLKSKKSRLKRWIIWLGIVFVIIPVLIIIFISPLTKYLIEKYDVKYTGREIKMDWVYVNPFTGYVHFNNLKIYEYKSDSIFLATDGLSADFSVRKLFVKNYEISSIVLDKPRTTIIMSGTKINLEDVILKFAGDSIKSSKEPTHFSILNIKINDGVIRYREVTIPLDYYVKNVNLDCSGIRWNTDTIAGAFSFVPGIGEGKMEGNLNLNYHTLEYKFGTVITKYNLSFIGQYFKALSNFGSFKAVLDANLQATGNFKEAQNLDAKGLFQLTDFSFGKDTTEDYCAFDTLIVQMKELAPKNHKYLFDSILLARPFFKFERYDRLDNIQTMFGQQGANLSAAYASPEKFNLVIEIGNYVKALSMNFLASYYQINHLAITKGNMIYNDYTLEEKFSIAANPMFITADSIDKNHDRVKLHVKSGILPFGNLLVDLSINPKDSTDFDLDYHFNKFQLPMLNPFIVKYTSFNMDRGELELNGSWHVRNGKIQSDNHLILLDPRMAFRVKKEDSKYIPMRIVMGFVRESSNVIDYEVPIEGNLKNPNFKLRDVITDLLANIFIKPVTTPFRTEVKKVEKEIENSLLLSWKNRQYKLEKPQEKFVTKLAEYLKNNPQSIITISPNNYEIKERESILLFAAKKQYYMKVNKLSSNTFKETDSMKVEYFSIKDSSFVRYLDAHVTDSLVFTVQDKCTYVISAEFVNARYKQLMRLREKDLREIFKANGTDAQVKFGTNHSGIPVSGFSYFKIEYTGQIPNNLERAYRKLNNLNGTNSRRKYLRMRTKYNDMLERKFRKAGT